MTKKTEPKDILADVISQAVDRFKIDGEAAYQKGVPYNIGGLTIHVKHAGTSNRDYLRAVQARAEDHKVAIQKVGENTPESREISERMMAEVFTESIITAVYVGKEKQPWNSKTKKQVEDMLCAIPEKFDELVIFASQIDNYRASVRKESEKN